MFTSTEECAVCSAPRNELYWLEVIHWQKIGLTGGSRCRKSEHALTCPGVERFLGQTGKKKSNEHLYRESVRLWLDALLELVIVWSIGTLSQKLCFSPMFTHIRKTCSLKLENLYESRIMQIHAFENFRIGSDEAVAGFILANHLQKVLSAVKKIALR